MATNIQQITIGETLKQTGVGVPTHLSTKGSEFTDISTGLLYINKDGLNGWYLVIDGTNSGGTSSLTGYTTTLLFDSHTGDTSNPHGTTMSNLVSSAHTHTLNEITDFNTYSGVTDDKINTKISTSDAQANYVNVSGDSMTGVLLFPATTTSQESLRIQPGGTFLTTTKVGAFEFVGNALYFTDSSDTRRNVLLGSSGSTATTLDSLSDTNVGGASDGDSFYYDATSGFWRNTNIISINDDTNTVTINNNLFGSSISGNTIYSGSTNLIDIFLGQTNFNSYSASTNTVITNNKNAFDSHTGDTSNPHGTTLSNLVSSAHTHPISQVIDLQTTLNDKFDKTGGTVNGNVVITGNVDILGTATTIHTSTLSVKDNIITLNSSQTGTTAPSVVDSGIDILRNSATTASLLWEEDNDYWAAGLSGSTSRIILQGDGLSLLNSGHTHPISEITNLQTELNTKALDSSFDGHTGNTTIHFTKGSINLSDLASSAHTHPISEIDNLQTELNTKALDSSLDSHTGNTSNPHNTTLSNLTSSAHTHPISQVINLQSNLDDKLTTSIFNTYSGSVNTQLNTKVEDADNISSGGGKVYSGKSGNTLVLRTISGGSNTTVTTVGSVIKIDSTGGGGGGDNFYVTGFTYNDANTFTISQNGGLGDISATINTLTGLTVDGVFSASTYTGITLNALDDVTTNIPVSPDNTYQGELVYFDVASNKWVSGAEYGNLGEVTIWGKKGSAGTIDKGCPVYITGFDNDIHEVELANASTATTMPVIGFTGEDFDNTTTNPIITFGKITGLDTTSTISTLNPNGETWAVNDVLYMSTTTGGLTKNRPTGSDTQIQRVAKVLTIDATGGQLFIFNTARTAGLPNLTTDYLWVGNGNDTPQEVVSTDVGITTTGFTYNNNNTFTISDDNGDSLSSTINQMSGLTINGDLNVTGDTTLNTLTATSVTSNSAIDVFNGHINLRDNSYFLQGRTVADGNVSLIGVDNQDRVFVGNSGYDTFIDSDTIVDGILSAQTAFLTTTPTLNNSGTDILLRNSTTGEIEYRPVSGITPDTNTFVTGGTLSGDNLILEKNNGINVNSIDLSGLVSGKTDNTNFVTHTGNTTIHFTKGDINLSDLGVSAHTHPISEVINLQTELDGKVETASSVGGANEVFSIKSSTDLQFRTISGGSNTTVTTVGNVVKIDSSGGGDTYSINVAQDGDNVDLTLDAASGSDSVVQLTAGSNITLTRNSANEVTIASSGGGGSGVSDANKIFSWYMNVT